MSTHGLCASRSPLSNSDGEYPSSPSSPLSPTNSARRVLDSRHRAPSPSRSPPFGVSRPLRRVPSHGSLLGGGRASPPSGNWLAHSSSLWPDGQFSASTNARISSPLTENALDGPAEYIPRSGAPTMGPDVVNSVWIESPPHRHRTSPSGEGEAHLSPSPVLSGSSSNESPSDKISLGFPRLSSLSLSGSPPVSLEHGRASPSNANELSSSPRSPSLHAGNSPESPPKVRSNIALPPRSGYSLSDDSDSVRSETDGSNGSGVSSSGSGSENEHENGGNDDDDDDDDESDARLRRWQMARAASQDRTERGGDDTQFENSSFEDDDTSNDADAEDEASREVRKPVPIVPPAVDETEDTPMHDYAPDGAVDPLVAVDSPTIPDTESLEDGLSSLERIFLFAKSDMAYHRVLVSRCLAEWIREVDLTDAVEYVIPLLNELATDEIEVSAVFAPELGRLMWFFFRNCPLAELQEEESSNEGSTDEEIIPRPHLPVGIFSTLLCALLLNPNSAVSGATQASIVEYFLRTKHYDEVVDNGAAPDSGTTESAEEVSMADLVVQGTAREGKMVPLAPYHFGRAARNAVLNELFENVAIAISRFDGSDSRSQQSEDVLPTSASGAPAGQADATGIAPADSLLSQSLDHGQYDEESALGRMMSVNLLAAITVEGGFTTEQLALRVVPEITSWPLDPAFFVRKEVAAAIGIIGKALVAQQSKESSGFDYAETDAPQRLLTAVNRVLLDHVWQVRQAACYSLPGVFSTQPHGPKRRKDLVIIMRALHQDVSPNVQLAAFEMIGEVIYLFHNDPNGVPNELVNLFLGSPMPTKGETERAYDPSDLLCNPDKSLIVAFNYPAVVLTMGAEHWGELRELYLQLTHHVYENVRNSLAASLHEIAKLIGSDAANADLVPVAERFLRDPCTDVTATLLEHMDEFWLVLPVDTAKSQLRQMPMLWLSNFSHDWRLRESIAQHIMTLAPSLLLADEDGCLVTLLLLALNDPVNALRTVGVQAVPVTYATFHAQDEAIADGFLSMICDLVEAAAYRQRVTFLHVIGALVEHGIPRARFEALILPRLVRLASDDVIDVRIALARTTRQVWLSSDLYPEGTQRPSDLVRLVASLGRNACLDVAEPASHLLPDAERATVAATLQASPPLRPKTLELGPARSLLDTTTIPWRGTDSQDAPRDANPAGQLDMEQDTP